MSTESNSSTVISGHEVLPQRHPFVFVDRVIELEPGKRAVGIKNVTYDEAILQGNFPERTLMPSSLIFEALAQIAGVALRGARPGSTTIASARLRFERSVIPGDQLRLTAESRSAGHFRVKAEVGGAVVAEGDIELK